MTPGTRVRMSGQGGVGTVRQIVEPKPGWVRALVFWHADRVEQYVDVERLEVVRGKVGARVARYCWRVIAVANGGQGLGNCGHRHGSKETATMCRWTPDPWPDQCDLLVREVRDDATGPAEAEQQEMGL